MFNNEIVKREKDTRRPLQIGKRIKVILSDILLRGKVRDRELFDSNIIIGKVEVSSDLSIAKVFVLPWLNKMDKKGMLKALNRNSSYFRHQIGQRLHIKVIPRLSFYIDSDLDKIEEVDRLLNKIDKREQKSC